MRNSAKWMIYGAAFVLFNTLQAQIRINEFQASNTSTVADIVDFEDYADWLELYNDSTTPVDLHNYYLTDNLSNPTKWRIPQGATIPAHGFLLLWADGHDVNVGERYQRDYWPWDSFNTVSLHSNFKLSADGEELGIFQVLNEEITPLIQQGSTWRYLDDGSDQGTNWTALNFIDTGWSTGQAELGYGDGDEKTTVSYGSQSNNKYITTYFRKLINLSNRDLFNQFTLGIKYDDGAVIYINGSEVARLNMPENQVIDYKTTAANVRSDENALEEVVIDPSVFRNGSNIIAVEIHQITPTSSDISFDLWLEAASSDIVAIDSLKYALQLSDISRGRDLQSPEQWRYFGEPTPGAANFTEGVTTTLSAAEVLFSQQPGFYANGVQLALTTNSGAEIYYTTNGTKPTHQSPRYTQPITINSTTALRARAFETGKLPGPIVTGTFLINETSTTLPVASFVVDSLAFWDETKGIYANNFKQREIPFNLEFYETAAMNTPPDFVTGAGTRIGGLNIWRFPQKPLTVYFRDRYGADVLDYHLFKSKPIGTFKRFVFRNGGDNWEKAMLRDPMTESIIQGQMLPTTQAYRPSVLFLNGQYWGIHNIRERFDEQFFASTFQVPVDGYDHLEYASDAVSLKLFTIAGSSADYTALLDYLETHDIRQAAVYQNVVDQVDMENFIDYLALELYVVNTSWRHNREWWRPHAPGAKWQWLIPDLDRGYNTGNIDRNLMSDLFSQFILLGHLIKNSDFKNQFIQRYMAHVNSTFKPERLNRILDSLSTIIEPEIPRHAEKWGPEGGISSLQGWRDALNSIKMFIDQRPAAVRKNLQNQFNLSSPVSLSLAANPAMGEIRVEGIPQPEGSGSFFPTIPIQLIAIPKPGYVFTGWSSGQSDAEISLTLRQNTALTANFSRDNSNQLTAEINSDVRLSQVNSPYFATSDIHIASGVTLTIDAGVKILMPEKTGFYIDGKLQINGTADSPVQILPNEGAGAKSWGALVFTNTADTSRINYLTLRNATLGNEPVQQKAAISAYNAHVIIDHLDIAEVAFPIFVRFGSVILRNSVLRATSTCDYINVKQGDALVENCTFWGNESPDTDGIDYDGVIDGIIRNNRFYNFRGFNSDAIDIGEEAHNVKISGNVIYNMSDKGISIGQRSEIYVDHNLIVQCTLGIAVKDSSKAWITNNTLYGNSVGVACYEKNLGQWGGLAFTKNNLFASSTEQSVSADNHSTLQVDYSFSNTENLTGTHNLFGDPKFLSALDYNFELWDTSPCTDAGDPTTAADGDGSRADIGAHYVFSANDFPQEIFPSQNIIVNEIMYKAHPDHNSEDWIELYNPTDQPVDLSDWTMTDDDSSHIFILPQATSLAPQSYLVLCRDSLAFRSVYGPSARLIGDLPFGLGSTDAILLKDAVNTQVFTVGYTNLAPWPAATDGGGYTLELEQPDSPNHLLDNWGPSKQLYGTPGLRNSIFSTEVAENNGGTLSGDRLLANYPNPFSSHTTISFVLRSAGAIKLEIYDITGRLVKTCIDGPVDSGMTLYDWNGENKHGERVSSGVYFYVLRTEGVKLSRKLLVLR
ncbi:MAG: CotH kinase family protein [Deferribacteres bacterium]|nr:CotH kinase family protein [candidate division KSB1 bacterium]MCB9501887.1 CotH kinase family protein [Deferribacteres bacterium]